MLRKIYTTISLTAMMVVMMSLSLTAQDYERDYSPDRVKIDRYLSAEVWTDHEDGEYFENDNVVINFLTNRDAYVVIYSVDTRGNVNLIFPSDEKMNNFVEGGSVYRLPGGDDDFDLVVNGPEGVETIQIIASREHFPIPDWYPQSGLVDYEWDDRHDFMDYINERYFVRYEGQRFAYDRASLYVNEWEPDYYRPIYYPSYPSWTVCGNAYIDYPYGGTVYINGVYWGIAPLYIPRIYVGWHTISIYDRYGYCWENDFHVNRYNTVVLDRTIIRPRAGFVSKYKTTKYVGYRNPVDYGYPTYKKKTVINQKAVNKAVIQNKSTDMRLNKKFTRGSTKITKSNRGYETSGKPVTSKKSSKSTYRSNSTKTNKGQATSSGKYKSNKRSKSSGSSKPSIRKQNSSSKSSGSSKVMKRKSGSSIQKSKAKSSSGKSIKKNKSKSGSKAKSGSSKTSVDKKSKSGSKSSSTKKESAPKKSSSKSSKKTTPKKGGKR